jgi:AAHS family 4-hydroxybenzoate transporter-like MFS transporter
MQHGWEARAGSPAAKNKIGEERMSMPAVSAAETALENQRVGPLQIRVVAICTLIQMCDGYDVGSIGWAVPSLTHAWHLAPSSFAVAFLWSNIGVMAGALITGPLSDRLGRKPVLIASIALFGLASLGSAFAGSLGILAGLRFFTGFGIAGGFTGTTALTGDYAPQRLRATLIMITFTGAPLGGFVGGQVVALLLHQGFGWPVIFLIGGAFPLALLIVMALGLPESPRFLARRANLTPRQRAVLQQFIRPGDSAAQQLDIGGGNPVKMLFGEGYALRTVLLWIVFFCNLINLYLFAF